MMGIFATFEPITLNDKAPGPRATRKINSLQAAISFVNTQISQSKRAEFIWLAAIARLNAAAAGETPHLARDAFYEAVASEGWID